MARALGLVGPLTATFPGPALGERLQEMTQALGPYPNRRLDPTAHGRTQSTRMIKVEWHRLGADAT